MILLSSARAARAKTLQSDIDRVTEWTRDWLMRLNAGKCKIIHFGGSRETHAAYSIDDLTTGRRIVLEESSCEKDLGIFVSSDLRWRAHVDAMASRANKVLGMLVRTFNSREASLWRTLYVSMVRPHLEFASTV